MAARMAGRVALVTGSSLGLGFAMAKRFAEEGADVALVARRAELLDEARDRIRASASGTINGYACDVSRREEIEQMFAAVIGDLGKVDVLVNNAGAAKAGSIESVTDEEWQFDLDLKLFAAIRLSRLVFPGMKERRWGRILNILNTAAKTPGAFSAPTSVTRAAGMALTKVLAGEGAPHNILVNSFNIGRIKSDQIRRSFERSETNLDFDAFVAEAGKRIPLGRMGEAEECANLACFLCSEEGSYITGTSINVDGGLSPVP